MKFFNLKSLIQSGKLSYKPFISSILKILVGFKSISLIYLKKDSQVANIISVFGLLLNIILAYFTFKLYEKTVEANNMSRAAITVGIDANKIARGANNEAKNANKINDTLLKFTRISNKSSDLLNRENMNLTKESIQAQIKALNQDKEQFLLLNKAFLSIDQIKVVDSIKKGNFLKIGFRVTNPGTYPAELISSSNIVYVAFERDLRFEKPIYSSFLSGFITKEIPLNGIATKRQSITLSEQEEIRNKKKQVFLGLMGFI